MTRRILITGGAGFIGSHLADALLAAGYDVRALDNLCRQVHPEGRRPTYLAPEVELIEGDVRDGAAVRRALEGVEAVFHFAAAVGVGQSMYEIEHYTDVNNRGTAVLLEELARRPVGRLIVASSMSIYGEGLYEAPGGGFIEHAARTPAQLARGDWEVRTPEGHLLRPVPTPEWKRPALSSVYALSKYDQERLVLMVGEAYEIPTVALRFFNAYGTRQALSNPYTGVLAIFAARLLNDHPPIVYEDGLQRRDFVSVHDVVAACVRALETPSVAGGVFNIGTGVPRTVLDVAYALADVLERDRAPQVTREVRLGDIRHCWADVSRARDALGYEPQVDFRDGLAELAGWLAEQVAYDRAEEAQQELLRRGLRR